MNERPSGHEAAARGEAAARRADPAARARVTTIPAAVPFLPTLAEALLSGALSPDGRAPDDPLALAGATVFLPTRRAARAFREALLAASPFPSVALPRILALGDMDEDPAAALDAGVDETDAPALPPGPPRVLPAIEARAAMAGLAGRWDALVHREQRELLPGRAVAIPESPADAVRLAADLLDLVEQVETQELDWGRLAALAPEGLSRYWQITLQFLSIAMEAWPGHLESIGATTLARHRRRLIDAEAARLAARTPTAPVVVAGSTGSVPATARLMATVARLPAGAIVLPGLDRDLDAPGWDALVRADTAADAAGRPAVEHPQFGLARLLGELGLSRADVAPLGPAPPAALAGRARVVSAALRPAATTDRWREDRAALSAETIDGALAGVRLVEAADDREEALAIAVGLREAVAEGVSAALVTPDRALARRVARELARWSIEADDSAGLPLSATPAGVLARLVASAATSDRAADILALLKHPLATLGLAPRRLARGTAAIERAVFRAGRLSGGPAAIRERLGRAGTILAPEDAEAAAAVADALERALAPLLALSGGAHAPDAFAPAHAAALAAVLAPPPADTDRDATAGDDPGSPGAADGGVPPDGSVTPGALAALLGSTADGRALDRALSEIAGAVSPGYAAGLADWPSVFEALAGDVTVRPDPRPWLPRVSILGPLEARLIAFDHLFLGGLVEGSWPPDVDAGPWMSRGMMQMFGLDLPERRTGLSAHDFEQGLGAARVTLSRPRRRADAPAVPSRWLQRLEALLGETALAGPRARGARLVALAHALDAPEGAPRPAPRPAPTPPVAARPRRLSITEIPRLVRDPYAIYARHVLGLSPLDPLDPEPGAADRGQLLHAILADFLGEPGPISGEAAVERFLAIAERRLAAFADAPAIAALWRPRMPALARAVVADLAEAGPVAARHVEIAGTVAVATPAFPVTLAGRADRIDVLADGSLAILDYKTGSIPSAKEVDAHLEPQLPLAGVLARRGGFDGISAEAPVAALAYVAVGGGEPPLKRRSAGRGEADALVAEAGERLDALLARYAFADQPYLSRARLKFARSFDQPYDHLARAQEWADTSESGEE